MANLKRHDQMSNPSTFSNTSDYIHDMFSFFALQAEAVSRLASSLTFMFDVRLALNILLF